MLKNTKFLTSITLIAVLASLILEGCGSAATTPESVQQSINQPAQKSGSSSQQLSGQQSSGQQPAGSPGQPPGNDNMTAILKRAAEILGISSDKFTTAFQNAMPKRPTGSDQQGSQPPSPPSGQQGQPPSGGQQGQPPAPSGAQSMTQSQMMTEVYTKMATELNISVDSITNAMAQAEKELKK